MPKRVAIVSLLLLAAVAATLVWSGRFAARAPARSAAVAEGAASPESSPAADRPAAPDAQSSGKLFGRVLEEGTDAPVAGAAVTAYAFETARTLHATSAQDGTFAQPDAPAVGPAFQLVVRHEGSGSASLRVVLSDDPVVVRLSPGGGIRGRVVAVEDGAPIPACRVAAVRTQGFRGGWDTAEWLLRKLLPEDLAVEAAATTGPDGRFEMAHVAPGAYALLTSGEGRALQAGRTVEVRAGSMAEVEIREPGTVPFFVDVIDEETGAPLDGAHFEVNCEGITSPVLAEHRGGGVYELRLGWRKGNVRSLWAVVSRSGYAPRLMRLGGGRPKEHQRVALGHGATIAGHVRTSNGPLPRAFVFVVSWGNTLVATAVTGIDGGFEIEGLDAPEDVTVFVLRPSLEPIPELNFLLHPGERRILEIGGAQTRAIEGRVVVGGAPAPDAEITLWGPFDSSATTGSDGAYAFEGLDPGRYDVLVRTDGQEFRRVVDVGEKRVRLDIEAPCLLHGMLVDAVTGAPVTGLKQVVARRVEPPTRGHARAVTDDDGRFRLHVEPGLYELDCEDTDDVHAVERPRVDLTRNTESGPVALRVEHDPQDGRIVLDVKDARTGDPVLKGRYWQGREEWILPEDKNFTQGCIERDQLSTGVHGFRVWSDTHARTTVEITLTEERNVVRQAILLQPSEAISVGHIERGAPEAIAGLREDDVILSFTSVAALRSALASARGAVAIEVERAGERRTVTLPAGKIEADLENILLGR